MQNTYNPAWTNAPGWTEVTLPALLIREYQILGRTQLLGWMVELCQWDDRPFILMTARQYTGQRPRYALTCDDSHFLPALTQLDAMRALPSLSVVKVRERCKLTAEQAIYFETGLPQIPYDGEAAAMWVLLTYGGRSA